MTSLRSMLGAAILVATAGSAAAQSNAERASSLNDEGKAAMQGGNFAVASERFQQAIVLSREGRFYFNLCVSLYQEGKFGDSLAACKAVEPAGADDKLRDKTTKLTGKIKDEMRKQGFDPDAPPPPDPTNPDPTNPDPTNPDPTNPDPTNPDPTNPDPTNPDPTNPGFIGQPPAIGAPPGSLFTAAKPKHAYTWTLGAELLGGSSNFGGQGVYTKGLYGFRALLDYLISPAKNFGTQVTVGVLHTDQNDGDGTAGIDVVDIGAGLYRHICAGRTCFTPLAGASLGLMQPDGVSGNEALLAIGFRLEGRVGYAIGPRFEHLISISAGFQGYTRGFDSSSFTAEDVALDGFSRAFVAAIGYTYRFNTPFGSSPFVTLE